MAVKNSPDRRSLVVSGGAYFASVLGIGLPVMYAAYLVFAGLLAAINLGWFVGSAAGISVVAAAFLVGMWAAGNVAKRVLKIWS